MNGPYAGKAQNGNGGKFTNFLVDQTPVYDGRRKHNKGPGKHRGNKYRKPNWLK